MENIINPVTVEKTDKEAEQTVRENAIEIKDVVIRYRSFKKVSIKKNLFKFGKNETEYFTAVKGVSFNVPKGEIVGIVGSNGSGKSTLLRAIAGIYYPDEGVIDTKDNTISLLALGVGFQKKLTGRENIILSGMLMGYTEEEVNARMKEIIAFAELGDFINKPVSTYSSGMHSKLAFAITSTLETDIILIDETLSVGDIAFRKKSYARMMELIENENHTVVIVSHNSGTIKKLCKTVIWLEKGEIKMIGPAEEVVTEYTKKMKRKAKRKMKALEESFGTKEEASASEEIDGAKEESVTSEENVGAKEEAPASEEIDGVKEETQVLEEKVSASEEAPAESSDKTDSVETTK